MELQRAKKVKNKKKPPDPRLSRSGNVSMDKIKTVKLAHTKENPIVISGLVSAIWAMKLELRKVV